MVDISNKTDRGILVSLSSNTSKHWFPPHADRPGWVNARALTTYLRKYDPTFEVKRTAFDFSFILGQLTKRKDGLPTIQYTEAIGYAQITKGADKSLTGLIISLDDDDSVKYLNTATRQSI